MKYQKKSKTLTKLRKKYAFSLKKTSKSNHFNRQLQVVSAQNVAHILAVPNQDFFGKIVLCYFFLRVQNFL